MRAREFIESAYRDTTVRHPAPQPYDDPNEPATEPKYGPEFEPGTHVGTGNYGIVQDADPHSVTKTLLRDDPGTQRYFETIWTWSQSGYNNPWVPRLLKDPTQEMIKGSNRIKPGRKGYEYHIERLHPVQVLGDEAIKSIIKKTFGENYDLPQKPDRLRSWQNYPQARLEDMLDIIGAVAEFWTPKYVKLIKDIKLLDLLNFIHKELASNMDVYLDLQRANVMVRLHTMPQLVLADPLAGTALSSTTSPLE